MGGGRLDTCWVKFMACHTIKGASNTIWVDQNHTNKGGLYYVCILTKLIWTFGFKDHMSAALLIREVTHSKKSAVVKNNNVILY